MHDYLELHLIIPGICGPLAETQSLKSSHVIDRWVNTLSRSRCSKSRGNVNDLVSSIFELNFESEFPSAALTLLANGKYDPALFYMHADPVHLRADMDQAVLTSSADLKISDLEAVALRETLNQHFDRDDLIFLSLDKNQWFVSSKNKINMSTTSLIDATGRNINFILPEGKDAVRWKQILTEAQMLMHSHEVNTLRENSGLMTINSLWFHGSGDLHDIENDKIVSLCSNDDTLKGLAEFFNGDYLKVPDSVNEYTEYLLSCKHGCIEVLHLAGLEHLVNYTDVRPWLQQLTETLDSWVYPLLEFANKKNIKVTLYPCNENKYQFSKYDILKFWRKDKLEKHVNSY